MKERLPYVSAIAALLIVIAFMLNDCSTKNGLLKLSEQNIDALMDSTRQTRNKLDQLQYEKTIFMGDIDMLRKLNDDLMSEAEAQKGNTRVVTRVVTKVVFDTIYVENKVNKINDSTFIIGFSYKKNYDSLNSISINGSVPALLSTVDGKPSIRSNTTTVSDMKMNMKIYTGIKEDEGSYSIFARTDFPGVKFDLDGAVIDPEKSFLKKKGPFSVMLGAGLGYGATPSGSGIFPSVGIYIGINLLNL